MDLAETAALAWEEATDIQLVTSAFGTLQTLMQTLRSPFVGGKADIPDPPCNVR